MISPMYKYFKTHKTEYLKYVQFIVCKLYPEKGVKNTIYKQNKNWKNSWPIRGIIHNKLSAPINFLKYK